MTSKPGKLNNIFARIFDYASSRRKSIENHNDLTNRSHGFSYKLEQLERLYKKTDAPQELIEIRDLRIASGKTIRPSSLVSKAPMLKSVEDPFPETENEIPEVDFEDLNPAILLGALQHQGALIVRNMVKQKEVASLKTGIDEVFDESSKHFGKKNANDNVNTFDPSLFELKLPREAPLSLASISFMLKTGSVWTFLSPKMCRTLLKCFEGVNLKKMLDDYFGAPTCLSFNKSVLRRMEPLQSPADWHQDGSFMTEDIKSINLWVSLSECGEGTDCPGMDFVPKRFTEIVETGTNEASYDWSVSHKSVGEWFPDTPPVRPHFNEGDAIFFDHYNLHVTSYSPEYTRTRYAIETWFFAEDYVAQNQIPIRW